MAGEPDPGPRVGKHKSLRRGARAGGEQRRSHDGTDTMTSISRAGTEDGPISADKAELEALRAEVAAWRAKFAKGELRDIAFTNSAKEVEPLYTALDVSPTTAEDLGVPGEYPFTRGIHPTGYRGKLWTMRQFAGFGSPKETNER